MKTSKRILSFFLAVVMIVTTCSVGFTAFAAENKTDSNNAYWNDATDAEDAFVAIENIVDTYIPMLLNIDAVKGLLEGLGMTITEDSSIPELIAGLSPTLLGLLGSSANKADIIETVDKQTPESFYDEYYAYLDGTGEETMNFYSLFAFCKENLGKSGALGDYCRETYPILQELLAGYSTVRDEYSNGYALGQEKLGAYVNDLLAANDYDPTMITKQMFRDHMVDGVKLSEIVDPDCDVYFNYVKGSFAAIGSTAVIENLADAAYYSMGNGMYDLMIEMYVALINNSGTDLVITMGETSTAPLTVENYLSELQKLYPYEAFLGEMGMSPEEAAAMQDVADEMYTSTTKMILFQYVFLDEDGEDKYGTFGSAFYRELAIGLIQFSGMSEDAAQTVADNEITDEQLQAFIDFANDAFGDPATFVDGKPNVDIHAVTDYLTTRSWFSPYVVSTLIGLKTSDLIAWARIAAVEGATPADLRNYQINTHGISGTDTTYRLKDMTLVNRANYMIPSEMLIDEYGTSFLGETAGAVDVTSLLMSLLEYKSSIEPIVNAKYAYEYDKYPVPSELSVEAVNSLLNGLIGKFLAPGGADLGGFKLDINGIITGMLQSEVDLYNLLQDLWMNLYNQPIKTIFNLLPTLVILIDEVIIPIAFTGENDLLYALLNEILFDMTQAAGDTSVGIGSLHFDLNTILPSLLHWLNGGKDAAIAYVGTYEGDIYDNNIPKFLNIYVVDKLLYGLDLDALLANSGMDATLATGLTEAIHTVLGTLITAVEAYLADHGEDARHDSTGVVTQKGLNNIFVALPQLCDYIGQTFIDKYGMDSDWTAYYDGKFVEETIEYSDANGNPATVTEIRNATLQNFKALATANDPDEVLNQFVNAVIGNWLNSLLDFLNDLTANENKITKELPLVFNLLNALGGFGEKSIISDLLNGLFQLKRSDVASFGLTEQEETNFVGFSNESGFFLISNLQFEKDGEQRGLIPLIVNLIKGEAQADFDINNALGNASARSTTAPYAVPAARVASAGSSAILTSENVEVAETLVNTLDTLLASLLENTSLNGFTLNATDNILSSVVALAATAIGQDNANGLIKLLDNYVYYVVGESLATPNEDGKIGTQPKDGAVDADKVYTSANLSNLVIQTYSLIENIIDYLFYNPASGFLKADNNMLIADAVAGIISPDSVSVRLSDDFADTAEVLADKDILNWNDFKVEITAANEAGEAYNAKDYLKFGFSAGDKDGFYTALAESLGGITAILGAVLASPFGADTTDSIYSAILYPVLNNIASANGVSAMAPAAFANADNASRLVDGLLRPLSETLACIYDAPVSMLLNTITGLAAILEDSALIDLVGGVDGLLNGVLGGAWNIVKFVSPTLSEFLASAVNLNLSLEGQTDIVVNLINGLLGGAVVLPSIDWAMLANAGSPAEALLLIFEYVVDFLLEEDGIIQTLVKNNAPELLDLIKQLSAAEILAIINDVIQVTQSPTEVYWTFSQYASQLTGKFSYPMGVTASDADEAITQLDQLVANVFPLLKTFGVLDVESLPALVNGALYTNEIITTIAKALYGALNSPIAEGLTIADILVAVDIDVTPAGFAAYLMDSSYGNTYSSAAATLNSVNSWNDVTALNWGFTNGAANAQQGFINGLAAVLRPLNNLLAVFLAQGEIPFDGVNLAGVLSKINIKISDAVVIENGVLTATFKLNDPAANVLKVDLGAIATDIDNLLKDGKLALGTNGYESAIIPLLEALCCEDVKTYAQYQSDFASAKDNLLINVLNPLFGFVTDVVEAPFDTLAGVLPNVALFIDGGGITQLVSNLLAPVTADDGLLGVLNNHGINVDDLIATIAGKDLGTVLTDALGLKGVTLELKLTELEKSNLHEVLIPLVNSLLKSTGIVIPNINWAQLASHGTLTEATSAAKNADGTYKRLQVVNVDKGETLVAVLRFIESVLVNNSAALKSLIGGLVGEGTLKNILNSVFTQIGTAKTDDLVRAIFWLLQENSSNAYFDYRDFTFEDYDFSWGTMDEDFCRQLAPMLDGLIGGLINLNTLVVDNLYKDDIISSIAVGLYKAVEGVKISEGLYLDDLLAQTGIDFTAANVAKLLVDEKYGQSYEDAANVIKKAGSWANVNKANLKWGVTDRESFLHALVAVLRPVYGVVDVLLNNGSLNLFNLISIPGSNAYTSAIVPLMEAFGLYNIKTQYQYREDIYNAYDAILLDILNPIIDKVEDLLAAPIQTLADILPNLSLFFANDGLIQFLENLLTPVSALLKALRPIVDVNELLVTLGLNIPQLLGKIGIKLGSDYKFDIYNLTDTLVPLVGAENVVSLLNGVLGIIKIGGTPLGLVLPEINWYQLASHGETIVDGTSQAACYGVRYYVVSDQDETLIAVLRFLVNTINYQNNYNAIVGLVGGLLGGASDSISGIVEQVLGMLQGDADEVIANLVDLLQTLAG